jgi:starch synthase (maltosyl-transferring)
VNLSAAWVNGEGGQGAEGAPWQMHDQLSHQRFVWQGDWHFVQLDPHRMPAHVFVVRRRVRSEHDFDYFE